jgi:quercetin dioxygenase-like cupin family protein
MATYMYEKYGTIKVTIQSPIPRGVLHCERSNDMEEVKQYRLKNIEMSKIIKLEDEINYQKGQVVSKTLVQNKNMSMTLFSFDKGEEISAHSSDGDAMVTVLDGTGKFTVEDKDYILSKGETIVMPNQVSHAVYGEEQFKMLLTVIF